MTCACGETFEPTEKRPDCCPKCQKRAYGREYRKRYYHERIKSDPAKLADHREQCRASERKWRQNHPKEAKESRQRYYQRKRQEAAQ